MGDEQKSKSLNTLKKPMQNKLFLDSTTVSKRIVFEASKELFLSLFLRVTKSLFYFGFYSVLSDFDFSLNDTSCYKVVKKLSKIN